MLLAHPCVIKLQSAGTCVTQLQMHQVVKMHPEEKALMDKAADKLIKKAADCFDLAKTQHHVADKQHEIASRQHCGADELEASAKKLERLGHALEADAAEIKGNTEVVARGISVPSPTIMPSATSASRVA